MKLKLLFLLFLLSFFPGKSWAGRVKSGFKQLEKKNYELAATLFKKELAKNPASAGAKYGFALYFVQVPSPQQNIDSSYQYVLAALADYPKTEEKTRKQWKKLNISDSTMMVLKLRIDSLGFAAALDSNRVSAYQTFLNKYPTAPQNPEATRRRDALAFAEARRLNTYESYKYFLDLYPNAVQVREVTEISELVLYESETRNGTVESYARFANSHPRSPYRNKADQIAFALFTAPHRLETYEAFLQQHPQNQFVSQAWAWALHLYQEDKNLKSFLSEYTDYPDKPYVEKLIKAHSLAYFPVYEEGKYGFLDSDGTLQIPIAYDSIASGYFCEGVTDDFILAYKNGKLGALDKTGKLITDFQYELMDELEKPLLQVSRQGKQGIVHEGGFDILPAQFDTVEVLNDFFIKTILNGKQGLTTMNGLVIFEPTFDEISGLGTTFVRLRRNGRYALMNSTHLLPQTAPKEHSGAHLTFPYDKVEWVTPGFVRALADSFEIILNTDLKAIMPAQKKPIIPLPAAWLTQDSIGYQLWFLNGAPMLDSAGRTLSFERVVATEGFYGVKYRGQWGVLDKEGKVYLPCAYDSLSLISGNVFLLMKKKNTWLHTTNRKLVSLADVRDYRLQPAEPEKPVNAAKMYVTFGNKTGKQALYTLAGHQLLPFWYESIRVLGPNLFLVEANRKATLKDSLNKLLLPLVYDGLNPMRKGFVATLKAQKFGVFHSNLKKVVIPPQYESLLQFYDKEGVLFIAKKKGKFGLVDRANKEKMPFQFDDIRYWLQSVALVKENEQWRLYDFANKLYYLQPFDEITYIQNTDAEIVLKVYVNQKYGILSSVRGPIIPAEYDDLGNAGDETLPFYVADKLVDTASVYLVFYFDQSGKLLRKQIFSEELYEKIVCE